MYSISYFASQPQMDMYGIQSLQIMDLFCNTLLHLLLESLPTLTNSWTTCRKNHLPMTLGLGIATYFLFQVFQTFLVDFFRSTIGFYGLIFCITLFEQIYAVFWSYSVLVFFKEYQNWKPSQTFSRFIGATYATYIIHQWIIIPIAVGLTYTNIIPILVILILILVAPILSWSAGMLLKTIPGSSNIL